MVLASLMLLTELALILMLVLVTQTVYCLIISAAVVEICHMFQDVISEFGVDTTRLCILSNVAPKSERLWSDDGTNISSEISLATTVHITVLFFD